MRDDLVTVFFYSDSRDVLLRELDARSIPHSRPQKPTQIALGAGIDAETIKLGLEIVLLSAELIAVLLEIRKEFKKSEGREDVIYKIVDKDQNEINIEAQQ